MTEHTLSISFKDTVSNINNKAELTAVAIGLAKQLMAAAETLKLDEKAVYSFIQVKSPCPVLTDKPAVLTDKPAVTPVSTVTLATTPEPALDTPEAIMEKIFADLKRTEKSVKIVAAFVTNSGVDLTTERLITETGLNKNDLSSWLAQTGKKIKAITHPTKGVYKFDPDKL